MRLHQFRHQMGFVNKPDRWDSPARSSGCTAAATGRGLEPVRAYSDDGRLPRRRLLLLGQWARPLTVRRPTYGHPCMGDVTALSPRRDNQALTALRYLDPAPPTPGAYPCLPGG